MRIHFGRLDPAEWTAVTFRAPFGSVQIAADERGVTAVRFGKEAFARIPTARSGWAIQAARELEGYFKGRRNAFSIPLHLSSGLSPFQKAVLRACARIRAGEVLSYGELSQKSGFPGAARAVGTVMARNPIPLFIPCHRVVASNGLGGYGSRPEIKVFLLSREGVLGCPEGCHCT